MSEPRYRLLQRLEAGGMAEVYVAEAMSLQGFKKKVAIKRVLPHLASNKNFIGMFLDEARLGARLNHTNVVTVFDIGQADNTYFIVLEYIDGCNLKKLIDYLRQAGRVFPFKEAIYITIEACRGLGFAHELTDDDGNILNIVHRDVSPPNILLSKRGEVKLTDFGLAKATTQLEKTDPGVVKGKFSYLSPEAAVGQEVDERADIFAMGIVLWEMLAGRRLFLGETDYQTVKLVQQANIPSIQRLNPEVDDEFEQILMTALAQDVKQRYQTARDFADALAEYLFNRKLKVTSYDIASLVKGACEGDFSTSAIGPQQSIIDKLIQEEIMRFTSIDANDDFDLDSLSPDQSEGARPLDAGSFENPAAWFSDEDLRVSNQPAVDQLDPSSWAEEPQENLSSSSSQSQPEVHTEPSDEEDTLRKMLAEPLPTAPPPRIKNSAIPVAKRPSIPLSEQTMPLPQDKPTTPVLSYVIGGVLAAALAAALAVFLLTQ